MLPAPKLYAATAHRTPSPNTGHRKLLTDELAIEFYRDCQKLRLREPMKDQFERALLSVVLNLAEGSAKPTQKDRRRFYSIALGSLRETQAILELQNLQAHLAQADRLGAHVYRLMQSPGGA